MLLRNHKEEKMHLRYLFFKNPPISGPGSSDLHSARLSCTCFIPHPLRGSVMCWAQQLASPCNPHKHWLDGWYGGEAPRSQPWAVGEATASPPKAGPQMFTVCGTVWAEAKEREKNYRWVVT